MRELYSSRSTGLAEEGPSVRPEYETVFQDRVTVNVQEQPYCAQFLALVYQPLQGGNLREKLSLAGAESPVKILADDPGAVVAHEDSILVEHGHNPETGVGLDHPLVGRGVKQEALEQSIGDPGGRGFSGVASGVNDDELAGARTVGVLPGLNRQVLDCHAAE